MSNIIYLSSTLFRKRNEQMNSKNYEEEIRELRARNTYDDMPEVAVRLLALFTENTYPIPVIEIAQELGFDVFETDMSDEELSGIIAIDSELKKTFDTDKLILVNERDTNEHKRFTIAHELAHYLFDAVPEQSYYNTYRTDESQWNANEAEHDDRERVANYFAANLLMPELDFARKYNGLKKSQSKSAIIEELAAYFGVPKTAITIRYRELGIQ